MEQAEKSGKDIRSLQHVPGLESPEVIERYQALTGGTFYCMYGQTETSAIATMARYNARPGSALSAASTSSPAALLTRS